jgi:hypothetical protein
MKKGQHHRQPCLNEPFFGEMLTCRFVVVIDDGKIALIYLF